jgi:ABC-type Fe3+/spermidine/putrescine transport system ATPase subunit
MSRTTSRRRCRCRNKFTAAFVGSTNLLEARLLGKSDTSTGSLAVSTSVGTLCAQAADRDLSASDRVLVSVRPEVIEIEAVGKGDRAVDTPTSVNQVVGSVVSQTFLGDLVETDVRVGETVLRVKSLARQQQAAAGSPVVLTLPAEHCRLVIDENAPTAGAASD